MSRVRSGTSALAGLALAASILAIVGTPAQADDAVAPKATGGSGPAPVAAPPRAAGLVVTTRATDVTVQKATDKALDGHTEVGAVAKAASSTKVVRFEDDVSASTAQDVAEQLEKRSDVVAAEPDYIRTIAETSPYTPNDPYFPLEKNLWDSRTEADSRVATVLGSSPFPAGGFSVKAPARWATQGVTAGSGITVAVLDTGSTIHPDLVWSGGYDMVADSTTAGDGDATGDNDRDANPADPGDWCDDPSSNSSWHGTHVAGIIAAHTNNHAGVAGIAPGVKLQPVRVLGHCGGADSDIAAGITWASGGQVAGIPDNPDPADVINMSFGGASACPGFVQSAIDGAISRGAVLVAAAGNDGVDASTFFPANCDHVIAVAATDEYGYRASYSNYGPVVDVAAPGGDSSRDSRGIWSTVNTGTNGPMGAGYGQKEGTSMAAPAVSAVAALLRSDGVSAANLLGKLKAQVQSFTPAVSPTPWWRVCTGAYSCGAGIVDLQTPSVTAMTAPTGIWTHGIPMPVKVAVTSSAGPINGDVRVMRGSILLGTGTVSNGQGTVTIPGSKVPSGIHPISAYFLGQPGIAPTTSKPATITVYRAKSGTVIAFPDARVRRSQHAKLFIWVRAYGEPKPLGTVRLYDGSKLVLTRTLTPAHNGNLTLWLPKISKTGKHKFRAVYNGDANVIGSTSATKTLTVTR